MVYNFLLVINLIIMTGFGVRTNFIIKPFYLLFCLHQWFMSLRKKVRPLYGLDLKMVIHHLLLGSDRFQGWFVGVISIFVFHDGDGLQWRFVSIFSTSIVHNSLIWISSKYFCVLHISNKTPIIWKLKLVITR